MWRAIVLLLGRVGLRPAERYGLRYTDFDFTEGVVNIERQFVTRSAITTCRRTGSRARSWSRPKP